MDNKIVKYVGTKKWNFFKKIKSITLFRKGQNNEIIKGTENDIKVKKENIELNNLNKRLNTAYEKAIMLGGL